MAKLSGWKGSRGGPGEPTGRAINNTYEEGENLGPLWAGKGEDTLSGNDLHPPGLLI